MLYLFPWNLAVFFLMKVGGIKFIWNFSLRAVRRSKWPCWVRGGRRRPRDMEKNGSIPQQGVCKSLRIRITAEANRKANFLWQYVCMYVCIIQFFSLLVNITFVWLLFTECVLVVMMLPFPCPCLVFSTPTKTCLHLVCIHDQFLKLLCPVCSLDLIIKVHWGLWSVLSQRSMGEWRLQLLHSWMRWFWGTFHCSEEVPEKTGIHCSHSSSFLAKFL